MNIQEVKIILRQPVVAEDKVLISITVGNGQIGGSLIIDDTGKELTKGKVKDFNLGNGTSLLGKKYTIITNVLDVNNNDPNHLAIVTHRFSNVKNSYRHQVNIPAEKIISFEVIYEFTAS